MVYAFARNARIVFIVRRNEIGAANGTYASVNRERTFGKQRERFDKVGEQLHNVDVHRLNPYDVFPVHFRVGNQPYFAFVRSVFLFIRSKNAFHRCAFGYFVARRVHHFDKVLNRTAADEIVDRETEIVCFALLHNDLERLSYQRDFRELDISRITHKHFFVRIFTREAKLIERAKHIDRNEALEHIALRREFGISFEIMQIEIVTIVIMLIVEQNIGGL